ncbi:MAG: hypothetical protein Ct9H300mP16_01480 [Pseudomonadota bacterium]|nr:MAG: hypothetical protein Ct9H300mP16_01480 [Pseudomonadota bacterium]
MLKIQTQPDRLLQYAMLKVNPATAALMLRKIRQTPTPVTGLFRMRLTQASAIA